MKRAIAYFFLRLLPETRCFGLKRFLLRFAGHCIGKGVRVCSSAHFSGSGKIQIGADTWIGHECMIIASSNVYIGACVDIAPRVYIGTGTHKIDINGERIAGEGISEDVVINDGAWLCTGCIILPGVTIGRKSIIAAGAVVNKDVISKCVYAGVPAKNVKIL